MYCSNCGTKLSGDARFCPSCGKPVEKTVGASHSDDSKRGLRSVISNSWNNSIVDKSIQKANAVLSRYTPESLSKKHPVYGSIIFWSGCFLAVLIGIIIIGTTASGGHDLNGTYAYDGRFPITRITFSDDGTFYASCDYYEYSTGATYMGKYRRHGSTYELTFTGAENDGVGAVTRYLDENIGDSFSLSAEEVNDTTLKIKLNPKYGYSAWAGTEVYFYKR